MSMEQNRFEILSFHCVPFWITDGDLTLRKAQTPEPGGLPQQLCPYAYRKLHPSVCEFELCLWKGREV